MKELVTIAEITLYFFLFAFFHSLTASLRFKYWIKKKYSGFFPFFRLGYIMFSLISFYLFWLAIPKNSIQIYDLQYPWDLLVVVLQLLSLVGVLLSLKMINPVEFFGIEQIRRFFENKFEENELDEKYQLRQLGLYKISRHPLYLFFILFLGFRPYMDLIYLTAYINIVIYFYIGSYFEEKRLEIILGSDYLKYKTEVSRIFPFKYFKELVIK